MCHIHAGSHNVLLSSGICTSMEVSKNIDKQCDIKTLLFHLITWKLQQIKPKLCGNPEIISNDSGAGFELECNANYI
jgi:hypothetical protein